ncbi:formylmethanofuran dehydrogenase [Methyloceanibacter sp.]|uniref:formylmethanofuran dehydrogenase n=1 Tax=Methyloceanibacter sp. TaxID=1965321 RepID=UPI003D6CD5F5
MQNSSAGKAKEKHATHEVFDNVACPFCGMLCDDLEIENNDGTLKVLKNGCGRAISGFERKLPANSPQIGGKDVTLAEAVKEAAALIGKADSPLFGGLATGVEGMRAALALAERAGGVVDHALSEGQYRNVKVLQSAGWITSTLTETRNRADLLIIVGSDIRKLHPRFFERIVSPPHSMFEVTAPKRAVVFIGEVPERKDAAGPQVGQVITLACKVEQIGEVLGALRARLRSFHINAKTAGGIALAKIDALAELCRQAKYGVVVWAPPTLDVPHAELTVEQATGLVKDLNQTQRFAGLSLGGNEGAVTAAAVTTWQSGFPLRISYASGAPQFDPYNYSISRMLAAGEGDLLVWIASISPDLTPPATDIPTIVLGTPGLKLPRKAAVFIPVGTPGVDHAGRLIRCDSVVSLPLKNLHRAELPRVADVLASIEAAL